LLRQRDWQRTSTGSVSKVTSEEIERQPVTNPLQALSGRVPGLLITENSGTPGAGVTVQTNFLLSGAYHRETAIIPGDFAYGKGSVHFAVEHNSTDRKFTPLSH
jgi:hypothetical protein